jgi:anti-sigma regulatory factor (Ser/Thr protein kinase)
MSAPDFVHEALLYRDDAGFLDGTVPFLLDGIQAGETVFALVRPESIDRLRRALGADARGVRFLDMSQVGRNPARIIPALRALVESKNRPARGIGEPTWAGRTEDETVEAQLHEGLLNVAFEDTRLRLRCPIDASALPATVLDAAGHSHPVVIDGTGKPSVTFDPKQAHLTFAAALPAQDSVSDVEHFGLDDLPDLRDLVAVRAGAFGLSRDRALDLTLATNEVVTNSICHGGERGTLRLWADPGAVVCEVSDSGQIADPLVGRTVPAPSVPGGRGLWLANQLCDLVQIRSSAVGTMVRLHMRRP